MSETGWLVQVPLKAAPRSSWIRHPVDLTVEVREDLLAMGVTRAIVLASPLGEQGQVTLDLDPEQVGQSDGPDRIPSIVSMALARMGAAGIVPSSIQLDGSVTMTWHLETGH